MEHQRQKDIFWTLLFIAYISQRKIEVKSELSRNIHNQDMAHQLVITEIAAAHVALVDL